LLEVSWSSLDLLEVDVLVLVELLQFFHSKSCGLVQLYHVLDGLAFEVHFGGGTNSCLGLGPLLPDLGREVAAVGAEHGAFLVLGGGRAGLVAFQSSEMGAGGDVLDSCLALLRKDPLPELLLGLLIE